MTAVLEDINVGAGQLVSNNNAGISITAANFSALSSAVAGNLLVLVVESVANSTPTINTPTGWTQLAQVGADGGVACALAVFYKISAGGEGDFTISSSDTTATNSFQCQILRFSGVDTTNPFNDFDTAQDVGSGSITPPTLVTTVQDCQIWYFFGVGRTTPPSMSTVSQNYRLMYHNRNDPGNASLGAAWTRRQHHVGSVFPFSPTYGGSEALCVAVALTPAPIPATVPYIARASTPKLGQNSAGLVVTPASDGLPSILEDDLLLMPVYSSGVLPPTITPPAGWTEIWTATADGGEGLRGSLYYKVATASEPSSYTWTSDGDGTHVMAGIMYLIRGHDPTDPIDVSNSATADTVASLSVPATTTTEDNTLVLYFNGVSQSFPGSAPPFLGFDPLPVNSLTYAPNESVGLSDLLTIITTTGVSVIHLMGATKPQASAGAPGSFAAGQITGGTFESMVGGSVAINVGEPPTEDEEGTLEIEVSFTVTMDGFASQPTPVPGSSSPRYAPDAIGCGIWTIHIVGRGGSPVLFEAPFTSLSRSHPINQGGRVTANLANPCGEIFDGIEPWRDEVILYRNRTPVFAGPLKTARLNGLLEAPDLFHWLENRFLKDFHGDGDVADVFRAIFIQAMEDDLSPNISISTHRTGIETTQDYQAEQFHRAADAMKTLAGIGIDFTMINRTLLAGGEEIFTNQAPLLLTDDCVLGEPDYGKEGDLLMTDAAVVGSPYRTGAPAPTGRAVTGVELYGLVQRSFSELLVKDNGATDSSAAGHLAAGQPAPRRLRAVLSDKCPFRYVDLTPGRQMDVRLEESTKGVRVVDVMRLVDVNTNVTVSDDEQTENVVVSLQPLGIGEG